MMFTWLLLEVLGHLLSTESGAVIDLLQVATNPTSAYDNGQCSQSVLTFVVCYPLVYRVPCTSTSVINTEIA